MASLGGITSHLLLLATYVCTQGTPVVLKPETRARVGGESESWGKGRVLVGAIPLPGGG